MKSLRDQFFSSRKVVTFKDVKIYHETETAVLVELNDQTVWLPRHRITVKKNENLATIKMPYSLLLKKFPPKKYKQFTNI